MDGVQEITGLMLWILAWRLYATAASPMRKMAWRWRGLVADTSPSLRTGAGVDLSKVPDYVEPVVAYRTWCWEKQGIMSFNGDWWKPGVAFEATCPKNEVHLAPNPGCTCGVHAGIDMQHLIDIGYISDCLKLIHGEVYLWGRLYKHTLGWRAQYAYPRSFVIPPWSLGKIEAMAETEKRVETLLAYNVDIYLQKDSEPSVDGEKVPLWTKERGWCRKGLHFLHETKPPAPPLFALERIAVVGDKSRIGLVLHTDEREIWYVTSTGEVYSKQRNEIVWSRENRRWETEGAGTATGFRFTPSL